MKSRTLLVVFTFSGFAGLVFEVGLQRELARAFGVSAFATSTVLGAYMAGLALGAWLLGDRADRHPSPLRLYALLELGVAIYAALTPHVSGASVALFARLAHGADPGGVGPALLRLAMAFAITLLPTVLMGGTLPALARAVTSDLAADRSVARLYTANTVGAAVGAALGTYALLPWIGLSGTLRAGAALNLLAAVLAWRLSRGMPALAARPDPARPAPIPAGDDESPGVIDARMLLLGATWSGLATFAYEVTWNQLLAIVVGNTAYAFGLMAAIFLVGLALGAGWVARQPDARLTPRTLGAVQLAASALCVVTLPLWQRVPIFFELLGDHVTSFAGREVVRALACTELMLVPAAVLGTFYPLLLRVASRSAGVGRAVGRLAAVNTLGAVAGSLLTGFVLLPWLGTHALLVALAIAGCGVAALGLRGSAQGMAAAAGVAVAALLIPPWDFSDLASGANVYFFRPGYTLGKVVFARESVSSGLTTVVQQPDGAKVMLTNGKFQGSTTTEVPAQRGIAQLPLLYPHGYDRALLVGVGTGCSLSALAAQPFREVEAVDLSRDIVDAAREQFGVVNEHVFDGQRVKMRYADGRNLLLLTDKRYDVINIELSSIWFAGTADLYNREFYQLVSTHLAPSGVLEQWVQLHHMSRHDLAVILASVRAELPHLQLFFRGNQGQIIASVEPLRVDYAQLEQLSAKLAGTPATDGVPGGDLLTLAGTMLLDERGIDQLIHDEAAAAGIPESGLISTDDNLHLEYSTPKANAKETSAESLRDTLLPLGPTHVEFTAPTTAAIDAHLQGVTLLATGQLEAAALAIQSAVAQGAPAGPLAAAIAQKQNAPKDP